MKQLTPEALHRQLAGGKRGGVYFLFGDEEFLKEEATTALVDAHLDPATRDFNYDQLRAGDTTPETMASIIATPPMMAEWRVVVVRDVQAMGTAPRLRAALEGLLERPIPGLLLILTAQIPAGRAQFYENLKKKAVPVECAPLSEADLPGWLMERARNRGFELKADAARLVAGNIGSELGILLQELNKLFEFAGEKHVIDKSMVSALVGTIGRQNRWEWFDMVADRKFREARRALDVLLDAGENGVGLVIGLGTQFIRLAIGVAGGQRALEEMLPPHQKWLANRIARQVRGWTLEGVEQALDDLLRADRLLKSTPLSDAQVMEELLLRLQTRAAQVAA
jgi:DNA polymerase III subunit delta